MNRRPSISKLGAGVVIVFATFASLLPAFGAPVASGQASAPRRRLDESEPSAPNGWWSALATATTNCSLQHFPPRGGYGTCSIICQRAPYNNEFIFRLVPPLADLRTQQNITSGATYHLRTFNLMNSYASLPRSGVLTAGVPNTSAALFTVESTSGQPQVNLATDTFFLRSGSQYCRIQSNRATGILNCNTPLKSSATLLRMPYNSYYGVSLTNALVGTACGAYHRPLSLGAIAFVNCTVPELAPALYSTVSSMLLMNPGQPAVVSGMMVGFRVFDLLYRYLEFNWVVQRSAPYNIILTAASAMDPAQWFVLEKVGAAPGVVITTGDRVTLRSLTTSMYCGIGSAPSNRLACNGAPSSGTLEPAYQFTIRL
ncbi:hypothetical protein V8C86DRAFT_2550068 [Haematococcus lacustris]